MRLSDRLREILYPSLVITILASLWAAGRAGEMEADVKLGLAPAPRWRDIKLKLDIEADREAAAARQHTTLQASTID
jgi:hypothetical protein